MATACTTTSAAPRARASKARLTLTIGTRSYAVRLEWWSADDCHLVYLDDLSTGQTTRVKDMGNLATHRPGRLDPASCSCSPGRDAVECRHVRALRDAHILPNWTRTECED